MVSRDPQRAFAAVAVRQQVDVVGEGRRRILVAVHPLVDRRRRCCGTPDRAGLRRTASWASPSAASSWLRADSERAWPCRPRGLGRVQRQRRARRRLPPPRTCRRTTARRRAPRSGAHHRDAPPEASAHRPAPARNAPTRSCDRTDPRPPARPEAQDPEPWWRADRPRAPPHTGRRRTADRPAGAGRPPRSRRLCAVCARMTERQHHRTDNDPRQPRYAHGSPTRLAARRARAPVASIYRRYSRRATATRQLTARLLLEVLGVLRDEGLPLVGRLVEREDRLDRAGGHAGAAVDALVG